MNTEGPEDWIGEELRAGGHTGPPPAHDLHFKNAIPSLPKNVGVGCGAVKRSVGPWEETGTRLRRDMLSTITGPERGLPHPLLEQEKHQGAQKGDRIKQKAEAKPLVGFYGKGKTAQ